ncbi:adenosine kinase [Allorhodopirellula heiligendammensis]|uniref:Inosine-guanosine kinase n=1 Tax=Allorhodopirellula heiligendammensis TaxID=2714739 RepID=A0A5C6C4Z5_9BACT|nr:adenosine kinase [Allorhodopirellula heiligendammensis]TWU19690.1 Inosine-guanosine kinase [Allorhodopirellula heiligendammensis]
MTHDVYAVGNALVDIQAQVNDDLLERLAFDKGIMTLVDDERQAGVLANFDLPSLHRCAGGSAANTVAAVADFGGQAAFVGKIGADETGEFFLKDLRALGVTIDVAPLPGSPTGTCAILITDDAERTMLTNLGASSQLSADDIDEAAIAAAQYIYIEGYLFTGETTKAAAYRAMELAKKNNVKVAFTASDPFLVNMIRDEIWDLIRGPVDLFFCNEEEAMSLTGLTDPVACANKIHESAENVAMTLGAKGSLLMHGGEAIPIEGVNIKAIDTTGAGDVYAGGVLYGITNGLSWKQSGHLASHAAARIVGQLGARLATPFTNDEVRELTNV